MPETQPRGELHRKEVPWLSHGRIFRIFLSMTWDRQRFFELELAKQQCLCHGEAEMVSGEHLRMILAWS